MEAGRQGPADGLDVPRIQLEIESEHGAVEVERQQPVPGRGAGYRPTSGLTRLAGRPPRTPATRFRAATADISERVRTDALAM